MRKEIKSRHTRKVDKWWNENVNESSKSLLATTGTNKWKLFPSGGRCLTKGRRVTVKRLFQFHNKGRFHIESLSQCAAIVKKLSVTDSRVNDRRDGECQVYFWEWGVSECFRIFCLSGQCNGQKMKSFNCSTYKGLHLRALMKLLRRFSYLYSSPHPRMKENCHIFVCLIIW